VPACVILITCKSGKEAAAIASSLLKKRLAACANIMPGVESGFRWNNRIERAGEVLLILKTVLSDFKRVEREAKRLHSYEVPEIIAIPIIAGSKDYLSWIRKSVNR